MDDDDEEEDKGISATKYPVMPSLVALQQMNNRLHLAFLGRKLMKWTAQATRRELRRLAEEIQAKYSTFAEDTREAYIMLARCRYFYPNLNTMVLGNIPTTAAISVYSTNKSIAGVKIIQTEILDNGEDAYPHLGIDKGGQAIEETKQEWKKLLKRMIEILQVRTAFKQVETANRTATKRQNVISKMIIPRIKVTQRFIITELEEKEREEMFRLKQFKKLKYRVREPIVEEVVDDLTAIYENRVERGKGEGEICKTRMDKTAIDTKTNKKAKTKLKRNKTVDKGEKTVNLRMANMITKIANDSLSTMDEDKKFIIDIAANISEIEESAIKVKECGLTSDSLDELIESCVLFRDNMEDFKNVNHVDDSELFVCEDKIRFENDAIEEIKLLLNAPLKIPTNKICLNRYLKMSLLQPPYLGDEFDKFESKTNHLCRALSENVFFYTEYCRSQFFPNNSVTQSNGTQTNEYCTDISSLSCLVKSRPISCMTSDSNIDLLPSKSVQTHKKGVCTSRSNKLNLKSSESSTLCKTCVNKLQSKPEKSNVNVNVREYKSKSSQSQYNKENDKHKHCKTCSNKEKSKFAVNVTERHICPSCYKHDTQKLNNYKKCQNDKINQTSKPKGIISREPVSHKTCKAKARSKSEPITTAEKQCMTCTKITNDRIDSCSSLAIDSRPSDPVAHKCQRKNVFSTHTEDLQLKKSFDSDICPTCYLKKSLNLPYILCQSEVKVKIISEPKETDESGSDICPACVSTKTKSKPKSKIVNVSINTSKNSTCSETESTETDLCQNCSSTKKEESACCPKEQSTCCPEEQTTCCPTEAKSEPVTTTEKNACSYCKQSTTTTSVNEPTEKKHCSKCSLVKTLEETLKDITCSCASRRKDKKFKSVCPICVQYTKKCKDKACCAQEEITKIEKSSKGKGKKGDEVKEFNCKKCSMRSLVEKAKDHKCCTESPCSTKPAPEIAPCSLCSKELPPPSCPLCGGGKPAPIASCPLCGAGKPPTSASCPMCGVEKPPKMSKRKNKSCPMCGKKPEPAKCICKGNQSAKSPACTCAPKTEPPSCACLGQEKMQAKSQPITNVEKKACPYCSKSESKKNVYESSSTCNVCLSSTGYSEDQELCTKCTLVKSLEQTFDGIDCTCASQRKDKKSKNSLCTNCKAETKKSIEEACCSQKDVIEMEKKSKSKSKKNANESDSFYCSKCTLKKIVEKAKEHECCYKSPCAQPEKELCPICGKEMPPKPKEESKACPLCGKNDKPKSPTCVCGPNDDKKSCVCENSEVEKEICPECEQKTESKKQTCPECEQTTDIKSSSTQIQVMTSMCSICADEKPKPRCRCTKGKRNPNCKCGAGKKEKSCTVCGKPMDKSKEKKGCSVCGNKIQDKPICQCKAAESKNKSCSVCKKDIKPKDSKSSLTKPKEKGCSVCGKKLKAKDSNTSCDSKEKSCSVCGKSMKSESKSSVSNKSSTLKTNSKSCQACLESEEEEEISCEGCPKLSIGTQTKPSDKKCNTCGKQMQPKQSKSKCPTCGSGSLKPSPKKSSASSCPNCKKKKNKAPNKKNVCPSCESSKSKQSVSFKLSSSGAGSKNLCPSCSDKSKSSSNVKLLFKFPSNDKKSSSKSGKSDDKNSSSFSIEILKNADGPEILISGDGISSDGEQGNRGCQTCLESEEETEISSCGSCLTPVSKHSGAEASNKGILKSCCKPSEDSCKCKKPKPSCSCQEPSPPCDCKKPPKPPPCDCQKPAAKPVCLSPCNPSRSVCCFVYLKDQCTMTKEATRYDVRTVQQTKRPKKKKCTCKSEPSLPKQDYCVWASQSCYGSYPLVW